MSRGYKIAVVLCAALALWSFGLRMHTGALTKQNEALQVKIRGMESILAAQQGTIELQNSLLDDAEHYAAEAITAAKAQGEH